MDTGSFMYWIETEEFFKDIAKDVDKSFDASKYLQDDNRPLQTKHNKKVIDMMKDKLAGKMMTKFVALRPKFYARRKFDKRT